MSRCPAVKKDMARCTAQGEIPAFEEDGTRHELCATHEAFARRHGGLYMLVAGDTYQKFFSLHFDVPFRRCETAPHLHEAQR